MKKTLPLICALTLLACGQENDRSSAVSDAARLSDQAVVTEGTFKMYSQARITPETFCDLHAVLSLTHTEAGAVASLSNGLSGICEIAVAENLRSYALTAVATSCGSVTYKGKLTKPADDKGIADTIELTDHRTRTCRDLQPARIIVRQNFSDGSITTLYSHDEAVVPRVTLQGALIQIMAIGGESTGYGLQLADDQIIEIALATQELLAGFEEGKKVEITGYYRSVFGIEIPERQVLVVETMAAL
jgi:hypothetical protein